MRLATVIFLIIENKICLARKKQFIHIDNHKLANSLNIYNGYGGKFDAELGDQNIQDTAIRELFEETGGVFVYKKDLENIGIMDFYWQENDTEEADMRVYFYIVKSFVGYPKETFEMCAPEIFDFENIPYDQMMPPDKVFLNKMFNNLDQNTFYKGVVRFFKDSFMEEGEYVINI